MLKRFRAILCSAILLLATIVPAIPATAAGPNLISNPSMETGTATAPAAWNTNKWGTNTSVFTYNNTGRTGTKSVSVNTTAHASGDAKWVFAPVSVSPDTAYTFSDWYQSTSTTGLTAQITTTTGAQEYIWLGSAAASTTWKQVSYDFTTPANASKVTVFHYVIGTGELTIDDASLTTDDATTPGPSAPTVSLTAPSANTTVTGTTTLTATADDAEGIASVQFKVDGTNVGAADTAAPYSVNWDSKTVPDGQHTISAVATDTTGLVTTSTAVNVTVSNAPTTPPPATGANLIPNPSMENGTASAPAGWSSNKWGTNTSSFSYLDTGRTGTRSLFTKTTAYSSGDAKWVFAPVSVSPNTTYSFSNWYRSNTNTGVTLAITTTSGVIEYVWLGELSASSAWKQSSFSFKTPANASKLSVYHYVHTVGELNVDDYSLTTESTTTPPPAPIAPTVGITSPAANAAVSGAATLSANAADDKGIASVQFKVDGANVGAADTTAPYSFSWDSTSVADGTHAITAVATDTDNQTTTSEAVSITVKNAVAPPPPPPAGNNVISNPSVETGTTAPAGWTANKWGTNTASLTYEPTGRSGSKSLRTTVSAYTSGDAKWMFNSVPVSAGKTYDYSNYYKSNTSTELNAMVTMNHGTVQYYWLASAPASPADWSKVSAQFVAPTGAVSLTIFQVISSVGYVQTDDFSLQAYTPAQFDRPLVSITFDDGWRNIYTNGLPLMKKHGLVSTQYLNSVPVIGGYPDYMSYDMIKEFEAAGHELGWHTRSHANMATLSTSGMQTELNIPSAFLGGTGQPASAYKNFATPYGAYTDTSVNETLKVYRSHRTTDVGYNTKDNFNIGKIKVQNILWTTTPAEVQSWVDQAIADKSWLVLVYHEVSATPADTTYAVTPANLDTELGIIKNSGVTVKTLDAALDEILSQL